MNEYVSPTTTTTGNVVEWHISSVSLKEKFKNLARFILNEDTRAKEVKK